MSLTRTLLRRGFARKRQPAGPCPCPRCGAAVAGDESFCTQCGAKVRTPPRERVEKIRRENARQWRLALRQKITTGRVWILLTSIITLFSSAYLFRARLEVEQVIRQVEQEMAAQAPEERAGTLAEFQATKGVAWDDFVRRARSHALVQSTAFLVLAVVFFGLYLWSGRNPFPAALTALLIFLTLITLSLILEPQMLIQSLLMKLLVFAGLASAVSSAYRYRRLYERPEPSAPATAPASPAGAIPPTP